MDMKADSTGLCEGIPGLKGETWGTLRVSIAE
jgi:hypothetical protein